MGNSNQNIGVGSK